MKMKHARGTIRFGMHAINPLQIVIGAVDAVLGYPGLAAPAVLQTRIELREPPHAEVVREI